MLTLEQRLIKLQNESDISYLVHRLLGPCSYNPECFSLEEMQKPTSKFWYESAKSRPTIDQLEAEHVLYLADPNAQKKVVPLTEQEKKLKEMRKIRDQHLRNSDYVLLADAPFTSEEKLTWREYRQFLRDYPQMYANQQVLTHIPPTFDEWNV